MSKTFPTNFLAGRAHMYIIDTVKKLNCHEEKEDGNIEAADVSDNNW